MESLNSEIGLEGGCVEGILPTGYRLAPAAHLAAAQLLGAQMARSDDESQMDAAQDAVVAYLEEKRGGTGIVRRSRLKSRLLAKRGDGSHLRPMLARSYGEHLETLPEWAL